MPMFMWVSGCGGCVCRGGGGGVGVTWVFLSAVLTQFHVVDLQPFVKPWVLNFAGPTGIALSRR